MEDLSRRSFIASAAALGAVGTTCATSTAKAATALGPTNRRRSPLSNSTNSIAGPTAATATALRLPSA